MKGGLNLPIELKYRYPIGVDGRRAILPMTADDALARPYKHLAGRVTPLNAPVPTNLLHLSPQERITDRRSGVENTLARSG